MRPTIPRSEAIIAAPRTNTIWKTNPKVNSIPATFKRRVANSSCITPSWFMKKVKIETRIAATATLLTKLIVRGIELPQTPNTDLEIVAVDKPLLFPAMAATAISSPETR